MTGARSPNYPAIPLPEALQRTQTLFASFGSNEIARQDMAKALGFGTITSSAAIRTGSALLGYRLLTKVANGRRKVSVVGKDALGADIGKKIQALKEAARSPRLFASIRDIHGEQPSSTAVASFLRQKGFSPAAIKAVQQTYAETFGWLATEIAKLEATPPVRPGANRPAAVDPPGEGSPFEIVYRNGVVHVSATLSTGEQIDGLIAALRVNKGHFNS